MTKIPRYRIAITGSNGQLGHELSLLAREYPQHEFMILSRETFPLHDTEKMKSWLSTHPLDFFINCAAYTAVDKAESEKEKAFQINAEAPGLLAGILNQTGTPFIQISTDYVFDGHSASPLTEAAPTHPVNYYGTSKLAGEQRAVENNPLTLILRTSWLYSAYGNNFVKTMIRLMKEKESIKVVADQLGSPTYAADLAQAIMKILFSEIYHPGIYHFSNEGECSWYGFAEEIKKLTGSSCQVLPIPSSGFPTPAKRPAFSLLDKTKIKRDYALQIPDWKTSLARCIELLKKQGV